jgi:hypothetical protein
VLLTGTSQLRAVVDNCTFVQNSALSFGGGLAYLSLVRRSARGVRVSGIELSVSNCLFVQNTAGLSDGGVLPGPTGAALAFYSSGSLGTHNSVLNVSHSVFVGNSNGCIQFQSDSSGTANVVQLTDSRFEQNSAGSNGAVARIQFSDVSGGTGGALSANNQVLFARNVARNNAANYTVAGTYDAFGHWLPRVLCCALLWECQIPTV